MLYAITDMAGIKLKTRKGLPDIVVTMNVNFVKLAREQFAVIFFLCNIRYDFQGNESRQ